MEEIKLRTLAQLMSQQSGEKVGIGDIVKLPNSVRQKTTGNSRYDAYAARTKNYTCLVHWYADGRVYVYVH